jgi:Flp pilus assembly protein TadG
MRIQGRRIDGQALVEFALLATILITLLLGIFDFGRAYYTQVQIKNAIADAGYYVIQHPGATDAELSTVIDRQLGGISPTVTVTSSCASGTQIQASYQYNLVFTWLVPSAYVTLGDETTVPKIDGCS